MKIRSGFVSNSSSSSFMIYGVYLEDSDIIKLLNLSEDESDDMYETVEKALENSDLEFHSPYGDNGFYIGKSFSDIGDDETGKQFKDKVESKLTEIFGEGLEFDIHEESWYDG